MKSNERKILAVASGGGHWLQLLRLAPAFGNAPIVFLSTTAGYEQDVAPSKVYVVKDANQWDKRGLLRMAMHIGWVVLREQPTVIVSTGAAPGYFALRFGKMMRARTIWVDSIANCERLSASGERVERYADLWLTQWSHLARRGGPHYAGSVL